MSTSELVQQIIGQGGIAAVAIFALYISRTLFDRWCVLSDKLVQVIVENTAAITKMTTLVETLVQKEVRK